jgi:hypothetical protein
MQDGILGRWRTAVTVIEAPHTMESTAFRWYRLFGKGKRAFAIDEEARMNGIQGLASPWWRALAWSL